MQNFSGRGVGIAWGGRVLVWGHNLLHIMPSYRPFSYIIPDVINYSVSAEVSTRDSQNTQYLRLYTTLVRLFFPFQDISDKCLHLIITYVCEDNNLSPSMMLYLVPLAEHSPQKLFKYESVLIDCMRRNTTAVYQGAVMLVSMAKNSEVCTLELASLHNDLL